MKTLLAVKGLSVALALSLALTCTQALSEQGSAPAQTAVSAPAPAPVLTPEERQVMKLQEAAQKLDVSYLSDAESLLSGMQSTGVVLEALYVIPQLANAGGDVTTAAQKISAVLDSGFTDKKVRRSAITALSYIKCPASFEALLSACEVEQDAAVRTKLFWAMERLTGQKLNATHEAWASWWRDQKALSNAARAQLTSQHKDVVLSGLKAVGQTSVLDPETVDIVVELLSDNDPSIRLAACKTLGNSYLASGPQFVALFKELAEGDASPAVRAAATAALKPSQRPKRPS